MSDAVRLHHLSIPPISASSLASSTPAPALSLGYLPSVIPCLPVASSTTSVLVSTGAFLADSSSSPTAGDGVLSWMLQSILPRNASGAGERVLIGSGLPCVPNKLLHKFRNWEFVELSELLPAANPAEASSTSGSPTARFSLFPGCEVVATAP